jgi:hypothetical protein
MLNEHDHGDTSKICPESSTLPEVAHDDLKAKMKEAQAASDAVKAHDDDSLVLGGLFGEALTAVKRQLNHGEYGKFCKDDLKRSASACSLYVRIYESRDDIQPALDWAAKKGHPLAHRRAVRPVLTLIADWRKSQHGESPAAPKAMQKPSQIIAELRVRLKHAEAEFVDMRDIVPPEGGARVMELVIALTANDMTAMDELVGIARDYHWRLRDLVAMQSCTTVQLLLPAPAVSIDAHR